MQKLLQAISIFLVLIFAVSCKPSMDVASGHRLSKRKYTKGYYLANKASVETSKSNKAARLQKQNEPQYSAIQEENASTENTISTAIEPEAIAEESKSIATPKHSKTPINSIKSRSARVRKIEETQAFSSRYHFNAVNSTDDELPEESIRFNLGRFLWHALVVLGGILTGILLGALASVLFYFSSLWQDEIDMPRKPNLIDASYLFKASLVVAYKVTFGAFMLSGLIYLLIGFYATYGVAALIGLLLGIALLFLLLSSAIDGIGDFCMPFLFIGWGR